MKLLMCRANTQQLNKNNTCDRLECKNMQLQFPNAVTFFT